MCPHVNWLFQGFTSFYTTAHNQQECKENDEDEALSEDAAHLFFSAQSPPLDPAQLVLKLGVTHKGSGGISSDVVLSFDDSNFYSLDFQQVLSISKWKQEQGCKFCWESTYMSADANRENTCACQLLPLYVTVTLKHVSMIIYSKDKSNESGLPQIFGVMDLLNKALEEQRLSLSHGGREIESVTYTSEHPYKLSSIVSSSNALLQQFLTRLDCVSESAIRAMDVCSADVPWMTRLLHVMTQHADDVKERSLQLKTLECQLESCLQAFEDEEQTQIATVWGAAANSIQQQEARAAAVIALRHTMEQKKQLEEAMLWVELMRATVAL